ncbi:MAG: hypothetical protein IBX69_16295 [Anaerolineales bacterium]|nr:hypothetical protein [Anaerolineales bacterium]
MCTRKFKETSKIRIINPNLKRTVFRVMLVFIFLLSSLSPLFSFSALASQAPTPLYPADGTLVTATGYDGSFAHPPVAIPEFQWSSVAGSTSYRIQISQDIAFTTSIDFTTPHTKFIPSNVNPLVDGLWYWRVRKDAPSPVSEYSSPMSFTKQWASDDNKPLLIFPENEANLEFYDSPTFSWQPVTGAASYRLQIATSPDGFDSPIYNQQTLYTTHQPLIKLENRDNYYWRVVPLDPSNRFGTQSDVRSFHMGYNQVPTLLQPTNNSFPTYTPTFKWTAVRGAQYYRLQYSTDPSFTSNVITVDTRNTSFTPTSALPNDINYYWRVRTHSGSSISEWSPVWSLEKHWYIQPQLLTPVNLYQHVRFPFFSWTPVPGASYYRIEYSTDPNFSQDVYTAITANISHSPTSYLGSDATRYWRVIAFDDNNNSGLISNTNSYRSYGQALSPTLIYPQFFYTPHEDLQNSVNKAVAYPVFMWNRMFKLDGDLPASTYRIQAATDIQFNEIVWETDTENLNATPTQTNPFNPEPNQDYYWRVRGLDLDDAWIGERSQAWKTQFDATLGLSPKPDNSPQLLRPSHATELVEATPLFEWWPMQAADAYEIQISQDPKFSPGEVTIIDTITFPKFSPLNSLAQRSLGKLNFGTFYWRVRGLSGNNPIGDWSSTWRFQIASQSQWQFTRNIGEVVNRLLVGESEPGNTDPDYDLSSLFASQSREYWFFGFEVGGEGDATYVLYLDLDHQDGIGANEDARDYNVSTIDAHQPEYAIYIDKIDGDFSAFEVYIHAWGGSSWNPYLRLSDIGGELIHEDNYIEIKVPNTAIGMQDNTGSYAMALFSVETSSGEMMDAVPANPGIPGGNELSHFTSVSERLNLRLPPTDSTGDPSAFPFVPPFFWDHPAGSTWSGSRVQVYLDPEFTTVVETLNITSTSNFYAPSNHAWVKDFQGDNTYYWRVRPRYLPGTGYLGVWSEGWRFERQGFLATNMQESVTFSTPTFSWDLVEGARSYQLQVSTSPTFGSTVINITTPQISYTPTGTLADGTYYWRVRINRHGGVTNEWSPTKTFTLSLPYPDGLSPHDPNENNVVSRAPTFCWDPLIESENDTPVLAAHKYRIQVSRGDPTFSTIYDNTDTEQSCWTPTKGYHDGKYYWRIAMIDGQGRLGGYSPAAEFTKQYPITELISPVDEVSESTPTFIWEVVPGASSYRLEVSFNENFSPLYDSVTTHNVRFTPTKIYQSNQIYYWRVAIIDRDGRYGPFNDATIILDPGVGLNRIFIAIVAKE